MKTRIGRFSVLILILLTTITMNAQDSGKEQDQNTTRNNLRVANSKIGYYSRIISWWDSGNGFICKVIVDNEEYLTRFDKHGKYVETLMKKEWNETSTLQPSFKQSEYNRQKVTGYWEVTDVNKKGYYLEMNDSQNNVFSVWVDDQSNFSTIPITAVPPQRPLTSKVEGT